MPKSIVADTGLDVLTHAIEAYVSVMASDYTDGLALHAIEMVFTYLEKSYNGDPLAREKMHNASCIAGMAFTNAFLGLNHSMAHKLGAECHIPHGRANAILLPYVIKYNATKPTKFASFPKYKEYVADERYAKIARRVGLCSADTPISEAVDCLGEGHPGTDDLHRAPALHQGLRRQRGRVHEQGRRAFLQGVRGPVHHRKPGISPGVRNQGAVQGSLLRRISAAQN